MNNKLFLSFLLILELVVGSSASCTENDFDPTGATCDCSGHICGETSYCYDQVCHEVPKMTCGTTRGHRFNPPDDDRTFSTSDGNAKSNIDSRTGWVTQDNTADDWLQVDMKSPHAIHGVQIKGRYNADQWVTTFILKTSMDGTTFTNVQDEEFPGNNDRHTLVETIFDTPITARYIRIYPKDYHGHRSLRFAVLLCTRVIDNFDRLSNNVEANFNVSDHVHMLANGDKVWSQSSHENYNLGKLFDGSSRSWDNTWRSNNFRKNKDTFVQIRYKFREDYKKFVKFVQLTQVPGDLGYQIGDVLIWYWNDKVHNWVRVENQSVSGFENLDYNEKLQIHFEPVETIELRFDFYSHAETSDNTFVGCSELEIFGEKYPEIKTVRIGQKMRKLPDYAESCPSNYHLVSLQDVHHLIWVVDQIEKLGGDAQKTLWHGPLAWHPYDNYENEFFDLRDEYRSIKDIFVEMETNYFWYSNVDTANYADKKNARDYVVNYHYNSNHRYSYTQEPYQSSNIICEKMDMSPSVENLGECVVNEREPVREDCQCGEDTCLAGGFCWSGGSCGKFAKPYGLCTTQKNDWTANDLPEGVHTNHWLHNANHGYYNNQRITLNKCRQICKGLEGCTHFVFHSRYRGYCYPYKDGTCTPNDSQDYEHFELYALHKSKR
jgi:hypothetical protein